MSKLEVQIGADTKDLQSKLASAIKSLDGLKVEQKELNALFKAGAITSDKYYSSIAKNSIKLNSASKAVSSYKSALNNADSGIKGMGKSTANATPALQEFSRVIQDAPFGIMGVGNNIQQLTANFGHLSKSAGGSKAALKLMIGALAGPGGVLLAVSAVTSLLTVFSDEIFSSEKSTKSAKEALEDYVDALNQVDRARVKGTQSAAKELTDLRLLKKQIEDTNIPQADRLKALNKLRDMYPAYLKGMTDEDALTGGLAVRYDSLKNAIIEKAKAQAAASIITDNEIKKIALENQLLEKQEELIKKRKDASNTAGAGAPTTAFGGGGVSNRREQAQQDINDAVNEEKKLKEAIKKIDEDNLKLEERIGKVTEDYGKGKGKTGGTIKTEASIQSVRVEQKAINALSMEMVDISKVVEPMLLKTKVDFSETEQSFDEMMANFEKRKEQAAILGQGMSDVFGAMANGIAQNINTGSEAIDLFAEAFIGSMSKVIQQMIQNAAAEKAIAAGKIATDQAVATSGAVVAGTSSAAASGPAAAFLLPALIAGAVAVIGGAFSKIGSFAKGTSSFSGDNNLAMVNRNEMILQPNQSASLFNAFKAGGTGLKGQSNGSSWDGEIKGNIALRGDNQRIQLVRANKNYKRFYS